MENENTLFLDIPKFIMEYKDFRSGNSNSESIKGTMDWMKIYKNQGVGVTKDYVDRNEKESRYLYNKVASIGHLVKCPSCSTEFIKTKDKVFCSNGRSGAGNCKDAYWNEMDPYKKNRALTKVEVTQPYVPLFQGDYFTTINNCCGRRMDFCDCK